jgi:hypothetical protein
MPYQEQKALFRQRTSTFAQATTENPVLLEGEKWWEVDAANLTTGRSKTGKDGRVVNEVIVGTAFNDLPFDPTGTGGGGPGDPTNLSVINRTAEGLTIASSTGADAPVPLATETLAGLQAPSNRAKAEGAVQDGDARLSNAREWSAATVDQPTAEAGSSTARFAYTPQRVFQAIAAWWLASAAKAKLDGIASGATANATNEQLRDRSTHIGTQPASTISGLGTASTANTGDFATSAQGALAATAVQPPGLASTLAAYLTTVSAASSYQPLSTNLTALAANNAAYYLARGNHSGTQALSTISGLGTGIANALAVNAGAAGAPVLFDGAGGTPSSLGLLNATGLPLATGVSGLLSIANGGTGTATPGLVAGTHVSITGTWPNQTISVTGGHGGGGSGGTVTSVGLSLPSQFTVTGSPVTTSGTLTATLAAQSANLVWAGPTTGAPAAPAFRSLVAGDIPTIPAGQVSGLAAVATTGAYGDLIGRPTLGTLAAQNGTFSGTSSGTNTGDQDLSGLVARANNLSDLANATTARANLGAASAEAAVTAVTHGSNASTARPSGVTAVYWIGTVEPVNAVNGDLWIGGI